MFPAPRRAGAACLQRGARLGKGSAQSLFSEGKEPEVSTAGGFCHSPPPTPGAPSQRVLAPGPPPARKAAAFPRSSLAGPRELSRELSLSELSVRGGFGCGGFIFAFRKAGIQLRSWHCHPFALYTAPAEKQPGIARISARCQTSAGGGPVAVKNWQPQGFAALAPSGNFCPDV